MSQPQYPTLAPNEIISPKNAYIKWHVQAGSTVRSGQLIAVSSSTPFPDSSHKAGGAPTAAATVTEKPKIIRARRIKRRNVPPAAAAASATPSSNSNVNINSSSSTPQAHSSFLGQYIQTKGTSEASIGVDDHHSVPASAPKVHNTSNVTATVATITTNSTKEVRAPIDGFLRIYVTVQCRKDPKNPDPDHIQYVLGKIEPCTHPAVIDGLCAVCGQSVNSLAASTSFVGGDGGDTVHGLGGRSGDNEKLKLGVGMETNVHQLSNNQGGGSKEKARDSLTLSGGITVSISKDYAETFSSQTSQSLRAAKKLNLVLDLDHTLLHATADRRAASWVGKCDDVKTILLPAMEGHPLLSGGAAKNSGENAVQIYQPHFVKLRPHLAEFLCGIMSRFEVTIYTAGTRLYAEKIVDVVSRHVSDHKRKLKAPGTKADKSKNQSCQEDGSDDSDDIKECLDEGELNLLREQVERTKKQLSWYKSRKERKEYVQRMIAEHDGNSQDEKDRNGNGSNSTEGGDDSSTPSPEASESSLIASDEKKDDGHATNTSEQHQNKGSEETGTCKTKKRKRVSFDVPATDTNQKKDSDLTNKKATKSLKGLKKEEDVGDDPSPVLKKLQQKLKIAEEFEEEAQKLRKKIFGSRIVSRTDVGDLGRDVKSLKRVFPCGGMMAAIVDDREDVWANADNNLTGRKGEPPDNLLLVKPYHWKAFQDFADVNNSAGEDLTESNNKEAANNDGIVDETGEQQLLWTSKILQRIYDQYYNGSSRYSNKTVPSILKKMRSEVLSRSNFASKILLSGLVPLHKQNLSSNYNDSPRPSVVRYAEELGAKLQSSVTNDLTHVVAARDGTDKILRARSIPGCAIVKVSWLMECYWSCTLRDIKPHILGLPAVSAPIPPQANPGSQRLLLSGSDSSEEDDEDDDFFANFEKEFK